MSAALVDLTGSFVLSVWIKTVLERSLGIGKLYELDIKCDYGCDTLTH
jgi:hypothetical protein